MNVIHRDRRRKRRVAKELNSNSVGPVHVTLVRISGLFDFDAVRFPLRELRGHVFPRKAEVIHDRSRRRPRGIRLPQHDVGPRELDQHQRPVLNDRAAHRRRPEFFLRLDIFHEEVDVPHPDSRVIKGRELRACGHHCKHRGGQQQQASDFHCNIFHLVSVSAPTMTRTIHPIRISHKQGQVAHALACGSFWRTFKAEMTKPHKLKHAPLGFPTPPSSLARPRPRQSSTGHFLLRTPGARGAAC